MHRDCVYVTIEKFKLLPMIGLLKVRLELEKSSGTTWIMGLLLEFLLHVNANANALHPSCHPVPPEKTIERLTSLYTIVQWHWINKVVCLVRSQTSGEIQTIALVRL